ncbi:MAG: nucleotidyltransferase family protein [Clostridia bacterium]|nr:nucleotidyltransferase family protein [Clostridia bacterium]
MTKSYLDMVYLFSCAVLGKEPEKSKCPDVDVSAVREEATLQGVWPFVLTSLQKLRDKGELAGWEQQMDNYKMEILFAVMNYTQRHTLMLEKIRLLEQHKIPVCILKGDSLAVLYAQPECRISGDVDILIPAYMEGKACAILKSEGFEHYTRPKGLPHVEADHPQAGHLEMHVMLYDDVSEEQWFPEHDSITEPFGKFRSEYGEFSQLGPTDGALFVFFHFVKHFLYSGGGIKQLADVLIYFKEHKDEINYQRVQEKLAQARCSRLFAAMVGVGVKYLGFCASDFQIIETDETLVDRLMEDFAERGGFMREADKDGIIFVPYIKQILKERGIDGDAYLTQKQNEKTRSLMFPSRKTMEDNYPYVKRHPFLLPVAWVHRAIKFAFGKLCGRKKDNGIYRNVEAEKEIQQKRTILAKDLEML